MGLLLQTPRARVRRLLRRVTGDTSSPLSGRTVLVTGASSGIGEATARAVAARGATVLLVARRADELDRVRAAVESGGGRAATYPCDLTDGAAVDALVQQVLAEHGAVDYLVNNAGRSIRRSLHLTHDRFHDFERTMAVNYFAPVRLTMGLLPAMRAQRFGHVVNVVTWGVQMKAPKFAAYIASKAALDTWSRVASRETYRDEVTFTNMRFALVRTPMVAPTEAYAGRRALTPEQAAAKVVRALEDRPVTVNTAAGNVGEVLNLVAPRLSDALFSRFDRAWPDSRAARGAPDLRAPQEREITLGAGLGGLALAFDSDDALRVLPWFTAVVFLVNAVAIGRLPRASHDERTPEDRRARVPGPGPLRNPGWLLTTFFVGVFWTNQVLLNVVIPLWLVEETDAPRVLLAFLFGTNTVMCIFLPMAAARGVENVPTALRAVRVSSVFFVVSCLITLATHDTVGWVTIALVWLGHVTVTGAELYLSAASWSFESELMDPRQRGTYQGAAELSSTLGKVWAPAVYAFLAMNWGAAGWLVIAGSRSGRPR